MSRVVELLDASTMRGTYMANSAFFYNKYEWLYMEITVAYLNLPSIIRLIAYMV
jgi:hypothetical protein